MRALWNPGDLHGRPALRLVASCDTADPASGRSPERAEQAVSQGASGTPSQLTAAAPPRGARNPTDADLADMEYLARVVLPAGKAALKELTDALEKRDPVWVAACCSRLGAIGGIARGRAANLVGRL